MGYGSVSGIVLIIVLLINLGLAFIPANIAKNKGYSFGGFWCLSFFASFLVGIIVAVVIEDKTTRYAANAYNTQPSYSPDINASSVRYCSKCGGGIKNGDVFCPKCGEKLE